MLLCDLVFGNIDILFGNEEIFSILDAMMFVSKEVVWLSFVIHSMKGGVLAFSENFPRENLWDFQDELSEFQDLISLLRAIALLREILVSFCTFFMRFLNIILTF